MANLKGKQKKLDANKDGKISDEDFAILRVKKAEGGDMDDQMNALAISVAPAKVEAKEVEEPMLT